MSRGQKTTELKFEVEAKKALVQLERVEKSVDKTNKTIGKSGRYYKKADSSQKALNKTLGQFNATAGRSALTVTGLSSKLGILGGVAIAGVGAITTKTLGTFGKFENEIVRVGSVAGASAAELDTLARAARDQAEVSIFGAQQMAQAQYYLASAGMSTNQIIEAQAGVTSLAAATSSELAMTSETVTSALSQFGLKAAESTRVANVYAAAISGSQASLHKLSDSMRYVGPVAASVDQSLEQTTAQLMALYDGGLRGEQAGTGLRAVLLKLQKPTKQAGAVLDQLGVSLVDSSGKAKDATTIMGELGKAGMSAADAQEIFGSEASAAALILAGSTQKVAAYQNKITGTNRANKMAEEQMKSFENTTKLFSSAVEELSIAIGEKLAPSASYAMETLTGMVGAMADIVKGDDDYLSLFNEAWDLSKRLEGHNKKVNKGWLGAQVLIDQTTAKIANLFSNSGEDPVAEAANKAAMEYAKVLNKLSEIKPMSYDPERTMHTYLRGTTDEINKLTEAAKALQQQDMGGAVRRDAESVRAVTATWRAAWADISKVGLSDTERKLDELKQSFEKHHAALDDMAASNYDFAVNKYDSLNAYLKGKYAAEKQKILKDQQKEEQEAYIKTIDIAADAWVAHEKRKKESAASNLRLVERQTQKEEDLALELARVRGDTLTVNAIEHKRFVNDWMKDGASLAQAEEIWAGQSRDTHIKSLGDLLTEYAEFQYTIEDGFEDTFGAIDSSLKNTFVTGMEGGFDSVGDAFDSFTDGLIDSWSRMLADMVAAWVTTGMVKLVGGAFGLDLNVGGASTGKSGGMGGTLASAGASAGMGLLVKAGATKLLGGTALGNFFGLSAPTAASGAAAAGATGGFGSLATTTGMGVSAAGSGGLGAGAAGTAAATSALATGGAVLGGAALFAGLGAYALPAITGIGHGQYTQEEAINKIAAGLEYLKRAAETANPELALTADTIGETVDEMYRLADTAGYTEEQIEGMVDSLGDETAALLETGKATVNLEKQVKGITNAFIKSADASDHSGNAMGQMRNSTYALARSLGMGEAATNALIDECDDLFGLFDEGEMGIEQLTDKLENEFSTALEGAAKAGGKTADEMRDLSKAINSIPSQKTVTVSYNTVSKSVDSHHTGGLITMHTGGPVSRMHDGGLAHDEVFRILQLGEWVTRRSSVNQKTMPTLQHINRTGDVPKGGISIGQISINYMPQNGGQPGALNYRAMARGIFDELEIEARRRGVGLY